jgi:formylglycine-generating enzyme required for sulfatase activity
MRSFALLAILIVLPAGCSRGPSEPARNESLPDDRPLIPDPTGPPPPGMVLVRGGTYTVGSNSGDDDERPARRVVLDPFYLDAREVANADFARFVAETNYRAEGERRKYADPSRSDHPVVAVTWNDAVAYATWAGKRLPSEAEWEAAARGGLEGRLYPNGDQIGPADATFGALHSHDPQTTAVGSHPPNGYGLHDMAGNVWEWCSDYYAPDAYLRGSARDPKGPERGSARVARGGSWNDAPRALRVANRLEMTPTLIGPVFGFRCAQSVDGGER